jgi:hypothetical protein
MGKNIKIFCKNADILYHGVEAVKETKRIKICAKKDFQ